VLSRDVVSRHSTPDIGSRCPWTPKHLTYVSVLPHLYTTPDLHHGFLSKIAFLRRSRETGTRQRRSPCHAGGSAWAFDE
jgi:hypothetical protein